MTNFNLNKQLDEYICPAMFKAGLIYYISSNNIKISSKKEFEKVVEEYKDLKIGD